MPTAILPAPPIMATIRSRMDDLTDDMKAVLKAAQKIAPDGSPFLIQDLLPLKGMTESDAQACVFSLREKGLFTGVSAKDGDKVLEGKTKPYGAVYVLNKIGRPKAKQVVVDERKERLRKINSALVWVAITILAGLFTLGFNVLDRRIERWQQPATTEKSK